MIEQPTTPQINSSATWPICQQLPPSSMFCGSGVKVQQDVWRKVWHDSCRNACICVSEDNLRKHSLYKWIRKEKLQEYGRITYEPAQKDYCGCRAVFQDITRTIYIFLKTCMIDLNWETRFGGTTQCSVPCIATKEKLTEVNNRLEFVLQDCNMFDKKSRRFNRHSS